MEATQQEETNQLFRNNGNGSFTEVAATTGDGTMGVLAGEPSGNDPIPWPISLADAMPTWSSAWGDYDNDGDMDCFIGGYNGEPHRMMRKQQ